MIILHDPDCADYGNSMRPEQPARVLTTAPFLRAAHPTWSWRTPRPADEKALLRAHAPDHLERLKHGPDFDTDTPFFPGIYDHARTAAGAALEAVGLALAGKKAFSLMRPPGHHTTRTQAMGFCYLNNIAIAALAAQSDGASRVAIWDFDAHHGNGTEAILRGQPRFRFVSVHQFPGYPGTGTESFGNCVNFPVSPHAPRTEHMDALRRSFDAVVGFRPDLVLVSAGFDAYARDPITSMTLENEDFGTLGAWLHDANLPTAAMLEGGYSDDLPQLVDSFLTEWQGSG